ncbi:unnamed protein product [Pelagomonas calceolata]|uniref:Uncharacterized protein n=1 Tax=Pelagomonas calceolata TaxID=35677 RepID=A0A8J2T279_9STRA|nr:unnamed protein product [Pelagomonas calceolata]
MRATMNLALLLTILQGASALQLLPRRTLNTPSTRTNVRLSNYLDQISGGGEAASKLAEADAAAAEADRLAAEAAALVASIKEEKETTPVAAPEPVAAVAAPAPAAAEEATPAPAADRLASRLSRVPPPAEDIDSFVSETLQPEYAPETTAVAGAALLAAGAVAIGIDIELATVAAVATAAVAIADEKSNIGQLTRAVGTVGVSGYNELKNWDEEAGFSSALKARAIDSAITVVEKAADAPGAKALALEEDEALVPASTLKIGEAVMVEETNRTGTVARCAANEWCTVTMDDDGSVETYRAPQLLRKEKVAVPFDPASSGELMLQRDEDTAQITSETRRRKRRWVVPLAVVALAAAPPVRAAVAPFLGAAASKARPVVAAVGSKVQPVAAAVASKVRPAAAAVASTLRFWK